MRQWGEADSNRDWDEGIKSPKIQYVVISQTTENNLLPFVRGRNKTCSLDTEEIYIPWSEAA